MNNNDSPKSELQKVGLDHCTEEQQKSLFNRVDSLSGSSSDESSILDSEPLSSEVTFKSPDAAQWAKMVAPDQI